ncbi:MAG: hypothetical protein ACHQ49_00185 [Elusimicrobiota bacterium]
MIELSRGRRLVLPLALTALAACAPKAVVVVGASYDPGRIKTVAMSSFTDFPGAPSSGDVAQNAFEKYLLANYRLVDPETADALAIGTLTNYTGARDETVMVDVPQEQTDPVYGSVTTSSRVGGTKVVSTQNVVTGYETTVTDAIVPETETVPAHVSMDVRLVDAKTSELLWSVSSSASGDNLAAATDAAAAGAMQAVVKQIKAAK